MVNTFGILSALVLLFATFVAYKNKEEYNTQIEVTERESGKRDRNQTKFETLRDEIADLNAKKDTANKSRDDFQVKLEKQDEVNAGIEKEGNDSKATLDETKVRLAEKTETLKELGEIELLAGKIEGLTISIGELEEQQTILTTQNSRLRGQKTDTTARLNAIKEKLRNMNSGKSLPTMKTSVASVSRTLGFVTLNGGLKDGVVGGSKVAVMRGGEKIGELSVTAVTANSATADVVQSSLKDGVKVRAGDQVIAVDAAAK